MLRCCEIRLHRPGDEDGIVRLFGEVFPREMTLEEWRWKYADPDGARVYSAVGVSEAGEIVAHYGGVVRRMIHCGSEIRGLAICDVMVHPRFRGLPLFKKMATLVPEEAARDGIILGYGFPTERALRLPEKLGLYELVEDVVEASKSVRLSSHRSRLTHRLFPLDLGDPRIDALWCSVAGELELAVIRDRRYLGWRYGAHPLHRYDLRGLGPHQEGPLEGLAVLRHNGCDLQLVDLVCRREMLGPLLARVESHARGSASRLRLWIPGHLAPALERLRFTTAPSGTCIPRTTHPGTLPREAMRDRFFFTMGDTDFF